MHALADQPHACWKLAVACRMLPPVCIRADDTADDGYVDVRMHERDVVLWSKPTQPGSNVRTRTADRVGDTRASRMGRAGDVRHACMCASAA